MTRWEALRFQISPWLAHESLKDIFFFRRAQLLASPGVCCSRIRNSRLRQASPALKTSYMKTTKASWLQEVRQSHTAFIRVFSGSNTAASAATVTGKHSFMYSTCSPAPATACSVGR